MYAGVINQQGLDLGYQNGADEPPTSKGTWVRPSLLIRHQVGFQLRASGYRGNRHQRSQRRSVWWQHR